jgi:uncharacterized protein
MERATAVALFCCRMSQWVKVVNRSRGGRQIVRARWCATFASRLRGLTFRRGLGPTEGLVLVESAPSRTNTAIHMWGVFFSIGVAWLDADGRVVDTRVARPWRVYIPRAAAQFVLEGPPGMLEFAAVGDQLEFADETPDSELRG